MRSKTKDNAIRKQLGEIRGHSYHIDYYLYRLDESINQEQKKILIMRIRRELDKISEAQTNILHTVFESKINLTCHKIHDPLSGYGRLILPMPNKDIYGKSRWVAWFENHGMRLTDINGFHNCTATSV